MNDKLQEYINDISTKVGGDEVREAIRHAAIVLSDTYDRQNDTLNKLTAEIRAQLDALWDKLDEIGQPHGIPVTKVPAYGDPEAAGGSTDTLDFITKLIGLLKRIMMYNYRDSDFIEKLNANSSTIADLNKAIGLAYPTYDTVEDFRLTSVLPRDILISNRHGLFVKRLESDITALELNIAAGTDVDGWGFANPFLMGLMTAPPDASVTNGTTYYQSLGHSDPYALPICHSGDDVEANKLYQLDSRAGTTAVGIDLIIPQETLAAAKYLILGYVEPDSFTYTWPSGRRETMVSGNIGLGYIRIISKHATHKGGANGA